MCALSWRERWRWSFPSRTRTSVTAGLSTPCGDTSSAYWDGRTGALSCATWNGSAAIRARRSPAWWLSTAPKAHYGGVSAPWPVLSATTAMPRRGDWPHSMNCRVPRAGRRPSNWARAGTGSTGISAMRHCPASRSRTATTCARRMAISGHVANSTRRAHHARASPSGAHPTPRVDRATCAWLPSTRATWTASRASITSIPSMR